ncbi:MAG TPA: MAPEG family protein [Methylophilus sp.]
MQLHIVSVYAAALALLFVYLSMLVIKQRRKHRVALGDGNVAPLKRAIAAHTNFAQYVPLCLILLSFMELSAAPAYVMHALCSALLLGRSAHAFGISREPEVFIYRSTGMLITFGVLMIASGFLFFYSLMP